MATYSIVAVARTPQASAGPTLVEVAPLPGVVQWTETLNEAAEIRVSVSVDALDAAVKTRLRNLKTYPLEVWVYREDELIAAGPAVAGEVKDGSLTITARGLEYYTAYMVIETDKNWEDEDLANIVVEVIDDWQNQDFGDFGINTVTAVPIGNLRTQALPAATERPKVYDFLVDGAGTDNGYDWWIDPETRELVVEDVRGADLSGTVFLELGVTSGSVQFSVSAGWLASEVHGIGTGPDLAEPIVSVKTNSALEATFGKTATVFSSDPVEDTDHLDDLTQAYLDDRGDVFFVPGPNIIPVNGAEVDDFHVGDAVSYTYDSGLGQISGVYRVVKKRVTVSETGQETISVEFA